MIKALKKITPPIVKRAIKKRFYQNQIFEGSHSDLLRQIQKSVANDNFKEFESKVLTLTKDLQISSQKIMSSHQKKGFLTTTRNLIGLFVFGNKSFLYRTGEILDDEKIMLSFSELLKTGIEIERKERLRTNKKRKISSSQWTISCAINYFARYCYGFAYAEIFEAKLLPHFEHDKVLISLIPSFGDIPITSKASKFYQVVYASLEKPNTEAKEITPSAFKKIKNLLKISSFNRVSKNKTQFSLYEAQKKIFLKDFLPNNRIETLNQLIVHTRKFIDAETFDEVFSHCQNLTKIAENDMEQSFLGVNYLARFVELRTILSELKTIDEYKNLSLFLEESKMVKPQLSKEIKDTKILMLLFDQDRVLPSYLTSLFPKIQQNGFQIFNLSNDAFVSELAPLWPHSQTLSPDLRTDSSEIYPDSKLKNDWTVDLQNEKLICKGINYYQGMYERVGRVLKVYSVDWSLNSSQLYFKTWLLQLDRLIDTLDKLLTFCQNKNIRVTFTSLQSHFVPYFALKLYAKHHPQQFNHVTFSSSYENWKSNVSGEPLSTLTMQNNNLFSEPTLPAFGLAKDFEKWFEEAFIPNADHYKEQAKKLTSIKRAGATTFEAQDLKNKLNSLTKNSNRSVYCMLGKIPYDLAVPNQGGAAHSNMSDWINQTIESIKGTDNILLIKPHPHEKNNAIANRGNEGFLDLINVELTDSIILLPHRGVSLQDLFENVDVFLCWNGSSIAELGSQNQKIIACDEWASRNYPIGVLSPSNLEDYNSLLKHASNVNMNPGFGLKSLAYVNFLVEAPFSVRIPFIQRSSTNINFNDSKLVWDKLNKESVMNMNTKFGHIIDDSFQP